jgi:uncharacterized protein (TIGR02246 family)
LDFCREDLLRVKGLTLLRNRLFKCAWIKLSGYILDVLPQLNDSSLNLVLEPLGCNRPVSTVRINWVPTSLFRWQFALKANAGLSFPKHYVAFSFDPRLILRTWREVLDIRTVEHFHSQDELDVHALFEKWAKAVRDGNWSEVRANHDPDILMFDVPPPFLSRGIDAYMATWEKFVSWSDKPVAFDFHDVSVTAGKDVAFVTAIGQCAGTDPNGMHEAFEFRLTLGLRKIDGRWRIMHEHHSIPAE